MKTHNSQHALPSGVICQTTRRDMISITVGLMVSVLALLFSPLTHAADVNVLIVGSTTDTNAELDFGLNSKPFSPTEIRSELEKILQGAGVGTVNVVLEERHRKQIFQSAQYQMWAEANGLATWLHYPYPSGAETARRANLRGESGTPWNYVILIGDPYTMEYQPGMYTHGVALIADEVAKSSLPTKPQTVLLMPWPGAGSVRTVDYYKEVVYRTGNSSSGCKVAPAALAWQAAGSPVGATHPTTAGAYIAASTIYSTLWGKSAAVSTYNYNDTLANTAHTTVTNNIGVQQYTGAFSAPNPFKFKNDKRRFWNVNPTSLSSDWFVARYNVIPMARDNRIGAAEGVNPATMSISRYGASGGNMAFLNTLPFDTEGDATIGHITGLDIVDMEYIRLAQSNYSNARSHALYITWAQIHQLYPSVQFHDGQHYNYEAREALAAYFYTILSGRCPLPPKPNPVTVNWDARRIGYETAWRLGKLQGRAPGLRTLPSSETRLKMAPGQTETMTVQFVLPPKADVTVNVSVSNPNLATVSPSQLTFTPGNYTTEQQVVVTCLGNADASTLIRVNFNTVSTDEVCNEVSDSWDYNRSLLPVIVQAPWVDVNPITLPTTAWVNVTASDPDSDALTYTWSKVSGPGAATFSPNAGTTSQRSEVTFSKPGTYVLKVMVSDGTSTVNGGEVTVQVLNALPVSNPQAVTAFQNSPKPITLTASDANGDPLTYVVWDDPLHGTLTGTGANLVYTSASGYLGSDSFTFLVNDAYGNSSPATVSITVLPPNTLPGVNAGTNQTVVLTSAALWTPAYIATAAWFDAADASTITASANAVSQWRDKSGNSRHAAQATASLQPTTGSAINGKNALGFPGSAAKVLTTSFTQLTTASIYLVVDPNAKAVNNNNCPLGATTAYNSGGSYITVQDFGTASASHGVFYGTQLLTTYLNGTSQSANHGFNPCIISHQGTSLSTQSLAYRIGTPRSDNMEYFSGTIGEIIICNAIHDAATREKMEGYLAHKWGLTASLPLGHPYKFAEPMTGEAVANLAGTAIDAEGDPLTTTWNLISGPGSTAFGNASFPVTTATFTQTGTYVLRLNVSDSYGEVFDDVTITVTDSSGNSAPAAVSASLSTGENIAKAVALSASDAQGNALTYLIVTPPAHGTLSGTAPNLTYTPTAGYSGSDSFTFRANDGIYNSNLATVSITVIPNLAPVIVVDSPTVNLAHLAPYGGVWVETTVTDDGYPLAPGTVTLNWSKVSGPGTVTFESPTQADTAITCSANGTHVVRLTATDGTKQVTRDLTLLFNSYPTDGSNQGPQVGNIANLTGAPGIPVLLDSAIYMDDDGRPFGTLTSRWQILSGPGAGTFADPTVKATTFVCNTAGVYILRIIAGDGQVKAYDDVAVTISGTGNAIPAANPQTVSTAEDASRLITLSGTDGNGSPLTYSVVSQPLNGTLSGSVPNLTYTPASNFNGTDSFTFKVNDGITDSLTTATVTITVTPVNDAPVASALNVTVDEDVRLPISLVASDVDGDALVFSIVGLPTHGTLSGSGAGVKYTPSANYNGSDSFRFRATDPSGLFSEAVVSIAVISIEELPVATPQSVLAVESTPKLIVLTGTDADNDSLTYSIFAQPLHGTLDFSSLPNVIYTSNANYFGTDFFTFTVSDGKAASIVATVSITVQPVGISSVDRIVGLREPAGAALGYYPNAGSGTVGGGGSSGSRSVAEVVIGHGLPILPVGAVITGATIKFEVTGSNYVSTHGLHAYLLDTVNPDTSGTTFFYNGPVNTTATAKFLTGVTGFGVKQAVLNGAALDLLKSYYGGDHIPDRLEAFFRFNLDTAIAANSLTRYSIGVGETQNSLTITYASAPTLPTVAWTAASQASLGESGTLTVTAQLSAASAQAVTVPFTVSGTATGADYSISATPITIAAGATTGTATITITGDTLDEPNETVILTMGTPTNATAGATTVHIATITDDDVAALPTVAWTTTGQSSTNESGTMTVTAQLSAASAQAVTVPFTVTGTATGADYSLTASPITIAAGATTGTATITITADTVDEANETVILTLGTPTNATLGATNVHMATITDDDVNAPPVVNSGTDQTVTLGAGVPWTPANLPKISAWYDAAEVSTIIASGGAVSQWNDKSPNNRHATQGTASARPNTGVRTLNGLNVVDFAGDYLVSPLNINRTVNAKLAVFTVFACDSTVGNYGLLGQDNGGWDRLVLLNFDANTSAEWGVSNGGSGTISFPPSRVPNTADHILSINLDVAVANGSLVALDGGTPAVFTESAGNTGDTSTAIGAISTGGAYALDGYIAEQIYITALTSTADRQKIEGYLAHKWGLTANLPAGHPYKTAAPTISSSSVLANLDGTVSDANGDPLTTAWSLVSGPGSVTFGNASAVDTTVTFTVAGAYTLRLTANDGSGPVSDDVKITVNPTGTYSVLYNGNGYTGGSAPATSSYASGATATVLGNTGNLAKTGFTFAGWNTAANGTGTARAAGSTFTMGAANVTLYAQWIAGVYDEWIAAAGLGGGVDTFNGDSNSDGMANGLGWLLGATNPNETASTLMPQTAQSGGNLTLSFKMLNSTKRGAAVLSLQYSNDLGVSDPWTNHTIAVPDVTSAVDGLNFVITPISGTDHNQVQVTIPVSAAGGTGKVFARMSGVLSP